MSVDQTEVLLNYLPADRRTLEIYDRALRTLTSRARGKATEVEQIGPTLNGMLHRDLLSAMMWGRFGQVAENVSSFVPRPNFADGCSFASLIHTRRVLGERVEMPPLTVAEQLDFALGTLASRAYLTLRRLPEQTLDTNLHIMTALDYLDEARFILHDTLLGMDPRQLEQTYVTPYLEQHEELVESSLPRLQQYQEALQTFTVNRRTKESALAGATGSDASVDKPFHWIGLTKAAGLVSDPLNNVMATAVFNVASARLSAHMAVGSSTHIRLDTPSATIKHELINKGNPIVAVYDDLTYALQFAAGRLEHMFKEK
jgi:hypothetical protein